MLRRFLPDPFTQALLAMVLAASLLPARGQVALAFDWITNLAIALLFFLHGAKEPGRSSPAPGTGGCTCWCSPAPSSPSPCSAWRCGRC